MRILIVEDEVIIAEDLLEIMRSKGFVAECMHDYNTALAAIRAFAPDLLFCDIDLGEGPDRTGIELVKEIRKEHPLLTVVYISALVSEAVLKKAQSTKPFTYLVKPFNAQQVLVTATMVEGLLQNRQQQLNLDHLTETEQKILQYIASGRTSKDIAEELYISEKTVKNHRYNIIKKLELPNEKNSLTRWAMTNLNKPQ